MSCHHIIVIFTIVPFIFNCMLPLLGFSFPSSLSMLFHNVLLFPFASLMISRMKMCFSLSKLHFSGLCRLNDQYPVQILRLFLRLFFIKSHRVLLNQGKHSLASVFWVLVLVNFTIICLNADIRSSHACSQDLSATVLFQFVCFI